MVRSGSGGHCTMSGWGGQSLKMPPLPAVTPAGVLDAPTLGWACGFLSPGEPSGSTQEAVPLPGAWKSDCLLGWPWREGLRPRRRDGGAGERPVTAAAGGTLHSSSGTDLTGESRQSSGCCFKSRSLNVLLCSRGHPEARSCSSDPQNRAPQRRERQLPKCGDGWKSSQPLNNACSVPSHPGASPVGPPGSSRETPLHTGDVARGRRRRQHF